MYMSSLVHIMVSDHLQFENTQPGKSSLEGT